VPSKQPRFDLTKDENFQSLKSDVDNMSSKLDAILHKLSGASEPSRPTRPSRPLVPPSVQEGDADDDVSEFDPWASSSNVGEAAAGSSTWSFSRRAARNIWISGLHEVCPDVPKVSSGPAPRKSAHFKLLKQKKETDLMPFLPEVSDQCLEASLVEAQPPLRHIERFYKTSESEEKQLLNIRSVPKCLTAQVPEKALQTPGLSEQQSRLHPKSKWGVKERLAWDAHRESCSYLRLTNNMQLSLTALESQLEDCRLQVELLSSRSSEEEDRTSVDQATESLIHRFNVMSLALTDLSYMNVDFLKLASYQYGKSLKDRADAWIQSTTLPVPVKQGLTKSDLATPVEGASVPLHIISNDAQKLIKDYAEDKKERSDKAVVQKMLAKPNPPQKQSQAKKTQPKQTQFGADSPLMQEFDQWRRKQGGWSNQGKKANQKGQAKGKQSQKQPFSKGKGGNKDQ